MRAPRLIGIAGYSGVGKDTAADILHHYSHYEVKKFAGKLKQVASLLTGIPVEMFEDQQFKKKNLGPEWDHMSIRSFLQILGTEGLRDGLHKNVWVNALFADYVPYEHNGTLNGFELPNWVISDVRFLNEAQAIKERGGIVIRIHRRGIKPINAHSSETALDDYKFDKVIYNNGSELDLLFNLKETLKL